ncbi:uncharacterized protein LOC126835083 [Adelges cooleyi]|uniref:uncharacterized protein LOC126835083 n=1 Tax=Adelges cooleyi TaxID=133065 RepID=UPI00218070B0|nr:uncharacterized protein LOC126835083 [Adelges cooleyi]
MKAKYLIVMLFIILINNCQTVKSDGSDEEKSEQVTITDCQTTQNELDLIEALFDNDVEEETDLVIDAIWDISDNKKNGSIPIGRLAHNIFGTHRENISGWLKEHRGLIFVDNNIGRINQTNFKLLLYATINLPELKDIYIKLKRARDASSLNIVQ